MASPQRKISARLPEPVATESQTAVVLPLPMTSAPPERDTPPMERIGDILRRERERRGDDLQQIADYLCIRRGFLAAIETSRYDEFPADAYVIGFLRSYAEYLGLNGKDAIDYYRYEMAGRRNKPPLLMPVPISEGRTPNAIILISAAVAAILVYAVWYGLSSSDRASVVVPPPPVTSSSDALPAATPVSNPVAQVTQPVTTQPVLPLVAATSTTPASIVLPGPSSTQTMNMPPSIEAGKTSPTSEAGSQVPETPHVVIKADQASWVLITDVSGHTVFDHVMKAGETYSAPNMGGLSLTTGNGSGITLTINGVVMPRLTTTPAHVLRNIPLNADALKNVPMQATE